MYNQNKFKYIDPVEPFNAYLCAEAAEICQVRKMKERRGNVKKADKVVLHQLHMEKTKTNQEREAGKSGKSKGENTSINY